MDLTGQAVLHKTYGEGTVKHNTGQYLVVAFAQGEKKFVYPEAFERHLLACDEAVQRRLTEEIAARKAARRGTGNPGTGPI